MKKKMFLKTFKRIRKLAEKVQKLNDKSFDKMISVGTTNDKEGVRNTKISEYLTDIIDTLNIEIDSLESCSDAFE